jgi:hypothetical protein
MENEPSSSLFGLSIDEQSTATLRTASQWGKVLSILGFILGISILILGFVMYSKLMVSYRGTYRGSGAVQTAATRYLILCVLMAGVFITGAIFTLNFSSRVATALNTSDQYSLNSGLVSIKSGIIFWAVIFIIFILLVLLAFIGIAFV